MAYTNVNFKTKKALKAALEQGHRIRVFDPGPFDSVPDTGWVQLEGPHFPEPHRWYARGRMEEGILKEIK